MKKKEGVYMKIDCNPNINQAKLNFKALNCTKVAEIPLVKYYMPQLEELSKNADITLKESAKRITGSNISVHMPAIKITVKPLEDNRNIFQKLFNLKKYSDKCLICGNEYYSNESFINMVKRLVNKLNK